MAKTKMWNSVTRYSRWGSVVAFLLILPILSFYIGREYERTMMTVDQAFDLAEENAPRLSYTNRDYGIKIELPSVWRSYEVVESTERLPWYEMIPTDNFRIYQFYTPSSDPAYRDGDTVGRSRIVSPADWDKKRAGKFMVFELLIFPKSEWQSVHHLFGPEAGENGELSSRVAQSFAGDLYAYVILSRDTYPEDVHEVLYMPTLRDIKILK